MVWLQMRIVLLMLCAGCFADAAIEMSSSMNKFSIDMHREISKTVKNNIICSPFSMYNAIAMLRLGAKEKTKAELDKTFYWNDFDTILQQTEKLYSEITERKANQSYLAIANKVWVEQEFTLLKTYVDDIYKLYKVKPEKEPLKTSPETVRSNINRWVEKQTNYNIKDLFPKGSITSRTKLVLANAIYFNATWENPFRVEETSKGSFSTSNGGSIQADYMTNKGFYAIHTDGGYDATLLQIPYSGDRFSMIFVRPDDPSGLNDLERRITYNTLTGWMSALKYGSKETNIRIPKFEFQQSLIGLNEMLKYMGIKDLFSPTNADLSGINGKKDLFCSSVVHKAYIKVDEKGTTAAASTGLVVGITSVRRTQQFILDRSFLFYIIDRKNDIVIFTGRVVNPSIAKSVIYQRQVQDVERYNTAATCFASYITLIFPVLMTYVLSWT